jgi:hypothetical protein
MYKAGTIAEFKALELEEKIPDEVYAEALKIVTMLDENYGKDRDVDNDDGGYIVIAMNKDDLDYFSQNCVELEKPPYEYVELISSEQEPYFYAFFLVNEYEFGINLILPQSIAPESFVQEVYNPVLYKVIQNGEVIPIFKT